jgi:hypothetical protein
MPDDNLPFPDIIGPFSSNHGPFRSQHMTFLVLILPLARIIEFARYGEGRVDQQSSQSPRSIGPNTIELVCGSADGG